MIIVNEIVLPEVVEKGLLLSSRPEPTGFRYWTVGNQGAFKRTQQHVRNVSHFLVDGGAITELAFKTYEAMVYSLSLYYR